MTDAAESSGAESYRHLPEPTRLADTITTQSGDLGRPPAEIWLTGVPFAGDGPDGADGD